MVIISAQLRLNIAKLYYYHTSLKQYKLQTLEVKT